MKKRTIIIGMFILFLVGVISIIGTYAIDSTITEGNSSTADYLFNITLGDRTNREVVIPSYDSKIVDIKISNPNEFNMSYLLYIEGVNSNISVINIKDTEASGVLASKTVTIIQVFIQNNSSSDVTITIKDIVGFEKETLTLPDNSTSINKGNYYKAIVRSNNNTYGKVKPNIKLSTLNGTVKYEIVPNTGYKYKSTTCNGSISNNILTISNITSNVNCEVVFEPIEVTVSFDTNEGEFSTTYTEAKEHTYTVPYSGTYKLEVWGGQGGTANSYRGGYGGYSVGSIFLQENTNIYVNVGGSGTGGYPNATRAGGYNGGGSTGTSSDSSTNRYVASGGGATHIATISGKLSTLSSNKDSILIVAGGGGGGYQHTTSGYNGVGGSGGGYLGVNGTKGSSGGDGYGTGGSQTSGGSAYNNTSYGVAGFGYGGVVGSGLHGSSGGGGYYGGGGSLGGNVDSGNSSGGGGSGYIGNSLLTDKYMYCYNCSTSTAESTKTYSTTNISSSPTSNYAKSGNGAAKITLIDEASYTISYGQKYGSLPTPTKEGYTFLGWYTEPNGQGSKITEDTVLTTANDHTLYAHWLPLINVSFDGNMFSTSSNSITSDGLTITYDSVTSYLTVNGTPTSSSIILDYLLELTFTEGDKYNTKLTYISGNVTNTGTGGGVFVVDVINSSKATVSTRNYRDTALANEDTNSTLTVNSAGASEGEGFRYWTWFETPSDWTFTNYKIKVDVTKNDTKTVAFGSTYGTMPTLKRSGYNFLGWYTGENGTGTKITSESIVSTASDHTLYAYWTTPSKYTTSGSYTYTVPHDGLYKLEVWGAQGGQATSSYRGGYGGYSVGNVILNKNEIIYINIGGSGTNSTGVGSAGIGGYNGGGNGSSNSTCQGGGGGGGATHIATVIGELSALSDYMGNLYPDNSTYDSSKILIVAGGRGGGRYHCGGYNKTGGDGGGLKGTTLGMSAGNQISGYAFGIGGNSIGGGGGGWYGGQGSGSGGDGTGSGGGSGYIGNSQLTDKYMYCYNCTTSDEVNTKTYTTTNVSSTPTANYAKSGSGAAIITFLGEDAGPPIGTLTANKDYNNINVSINATDDMGIDHYEYYLGTSSTCPTEGYTISSSSSHKFDITETGTYYVCARVVDIAHNVLSLVSQPINYSRIYSVKVRYNVNGGTITPNTSTYTWTTDDTGLIYQNGNIYEQVIRHGTPADLANYNNSEFINITPTDDLNVVSGSEWICLSGCSESNKLYSQTTKYNTSDFCDVTDNNCTVVLGLNLVGDATPPTCTLSANSSTITASASDSGGSGLAYNGWSSSYSGSNSTSKSIATGTHTYYVKDGAGNTNSCSISIIATTKGSYVDCGSYLEDSGGCYYWKSATANASGSCTCRTATSATYTGTCSVSGGTASCSCSSPVTNTCSVSYSCSSGYLAGSSCKIYTSGTTVTTYTCPSKYTKINNSYCYK